MNKIILYDMSLYRPLFTDGWNSLWHVVFGMMSVWFWWIIPIFIVYQVKDYKDPNLWIDLAEFFFGWIFMSVLTR
jgi:type VI protein secretion system component VasK